MQKSRCRYRESQVRKSPAEKIDDDLEKVAAEAKKLPLQRKTFKSAAFKPFFGSFKYYRHFWFPAEVAALMESEAGITELTMKKTGTFSKYFFRIIFNTFYKTNFQNTISKLFKKQF